MTGQRMEPKTIPKKQVQDTTNNNNNNNDDVLNAQLMEARICQLISSLRALVRSNKELEAALLEEPEDYDFISAVKENQNVIHKQLQLIMTLANKMKQVGIHNYQLPDDIYKIISQSSTNQQQQQQQQEPESQVQNTSHETQNEGLYL